MLKGSTKQFGWLQAPQPILRTTDVSHRGRSFAAAQHGAPRQDNTPAYREENCMNHR
jgi:hypothetical protein